VATRRTPVSIVTVFNDPDVRRQCLDRSFEAHRGEAPDSEYLPIDNSGGVFATAGAALNHGAAQARHDHVVFVHQDVCLHSVSALEQAAGMLAADDSIGVLGAIGPTADARYLGRVRDRVFLLGEPVSEPAEVDCVDEVLFIVSRGTLARRPLAEDPALAWHAYAVEYGLRARAEGQRVCVADIPLTHNSLTVNLDRLEVAYAALAERYPDGMPVMTPQGQVGGPKRPRDRITVLDQHRWRFRWLIESRDAIAGRRAAGGSPCVLADIRLDVDDLIARVPAQTPLLVVNADRYGSFADERPGPLALTRLGRPVLVTSAPVAGVSATVARSASGGPVLITNLELRDVKTLAAELPARRRVLGYRTSTGYWMLSGATPAMIPPQWLGPQATPVGMRALDLLAA
jgi:hypothetical protein